MPDEPNAFARIPHRNPFWMFWRPRVEWRDVSIEEALEHCRVISEQARSYWRKP